MKKCKKCGREYDDSMNFCSICGGGLAEVSDSNLKIGDNNAISADKIVSGGEHHTHNQTTIYNNQAPQEKTPSVEITLKIISTDAPCHIYKDKEEVCTVEQGRMAKVVLHQKGSYIFDFVNVTDSTQSIEDYLYKATDNDDEILYINLGKDSVETAAERKESIHLAKIKRKQEEEAEQRRKAEELKRKQEAEEQQRIAEELKRKQEAEEQARLEKRRRELEQRERELKLQKEAEELKRRQEAEQRRKAEELKRKQEAERLKSLPKKIFTWEDYKAMGSPSHLDIPNNYTKIEPLFRGYLDTYNSRFLYSITIPNSVTSIGDRAFLNCDSLTSITIPNSVTSIGDEAFSYCSKLTSITIPNSVTSIGDKAFAYCGSLISITIPNSVTSIGGGVFIGCYELTPIGVELNNLKFVLHDGILYNSTRTKIISVLRTSVKGNIIIPNSVTSIGTEAFCGCKSLTSITIPNSVTSIGDEAFSYCSKLTSITIPNSVTSIGDNVFLESDNLNSITISKNSLIYKKLKKEYGYIVNPIIKLPRLF